MDLSSICVPASVKAQMILCKEIALKCFNVSIKTVAVPVWVATVFCYFVQRPTFSFFRV